jgi:hypothetical protein
MRYFTLAGLFGICAIVACLDGAYSYVGVGTTVPEYTAISFSSSSFDELKKRFGLEQLALCKLQCATCKLQRCCGGRAYRPQLWKTVHPISIIIIR